MTTKSFTTDGRTIEVSNANKVLFPDIGLTEGQLAEYYAQVAGTMLPHLRGRPLSMQRFPKGIGERGFYAKEMPDYFPEWIDHVDVDVLETGEVQPQVVCNDAATLIYLVDQACITPHTWLSRRPHLNQPDKLIFDLDPPRSFETAREAARSLRTLLDELELPAYLMTTGSRGLHIGIPLDSQAGFDAVRAFAVELAEALARRAPDKLTTETRKNARRGRLFLDYLRNSYAQTSVPPYAVRARPGAPVATPIRWEELDDPELTSSRYTVANVLNKIAREGDPWADFHERGCSLTAVRARLGALR